ncbi:MAG TPA: LptF/LptG family permease, partial [Steroidobacteraceae bacterium]
MRLISRHILRTMAAPFVWGIAALTGLLLLNSLPPLIDSFGGKGIPARTMIEGVILFVPALVALTLPMAVLVAVLYGYSQLAANLEIQAMYASGVSVWRMARPALVGGAVVAVLNFFVFDQLMPQSNARFTNLRGAALNKTPTLALRQQVLNIMPAQAGASPGFIIRADVIEQETGAMRDVTIFDLTDYVERRLIRADSGVMAMSANGRDLILTLHSGVIYDFKRDEPGRLEQTNFVHNRLVVRNVQNNLAQSTLQMGKDPREMTSCELLDGIADTRWKLNRYEGQAEYLTRRDLRALTGLPPLLQPAEQVQPPTRPHCGGYRRFENWFKSLMLPQKLSAQTPQQGASQQPQNPPA